MPLRAARLNHGYTVKEIAQRVGIKPATYYYYERTGGMPRDPKVAKAIADLFGARVTDLWPVGWNGAERRAA